MFHMVRRYYLMKTGHCSIQKMRKDVSSWGQDFLAITGGCYIIQVVFVRDNFW